MNKGDLAAAVAERTGIGRSDASRAVDAVFEVIGAKLKQGEEVRISGFGGFAVNDRAASTGRNPQTGEALQIKASKQPKFKPGKGLKDLLNG